VETLLDGKSGAMMGLLGRQVVATSLEEVLAKPRPLNPYTVRVADMLSR